MSFQPHAASLSSSSTGTTHVNGDTIYRIGSLSKLITAYLFLLEAGPKYWSHAVTDFVPELKRRTQECLSRQDAIDCIDSTGITWGALASHESGIGREVSGPHDFLSTWRYTCCVWPAYPSHTSIQSMRRGQHQYTQMLAITCLVLL